MSSKWEFDKQTCGFNQAKVGSYATMMRNQPTKNGNVANQQVEFSTSECGCN